MVATTAGPVLALGLDPSGIERGAAVAQEAFAKIGTSSKIAANDIDGAGKSLRGIKEIALGSLAGLGLGFGIQSLSRIPAAFIKIADEITAMESRLRLATTSAGEFRAAWSAIFSISNEAGVGVTAIGDLYSKLSLATGDLGASQEELEKFTRAVAQALAISGTSAQQASGAILQLSKAIDSGIVGASEFNSVLGDAPRIARAVAAGFDDTGVSVAELRKKVAAGEVTSRQFFDALLSQAPELQREMDQTADTVGRAGTTMANSIAALVGRLNESTGVTRTLASALRGIADETSRIINLTSSDAAAKLKQLQEDLKDAQKAPTFFGYELPRTASQERGARVIQDQINKVRPLVDQQEFETSRDAMITQMRKEYEASIIPLPKARFEDVAAAAREDRDKKTAAENKRQASEAESAAAKAEAAARRLLSAQRESDVLQSKTLEDTGKFADAFRMRADADIAAWKEQAREAGLSAEATQKGIDAIRESSEHAIAERLSAGQKMLAELVVAELSATGQVREAAAERTKIAIDEWNERARVAGISAEQIARGEQLISSAAKAEADQRLKVGADALAQMEIVELDKTGKSQEASELRKQADIDAWKAQATQAGLSAEKTARGIKLIENQYARSTDTGTKFFDAMGDAAEAIATRIGDEFTTMFTTIVSGGKLTAQQVTDTFARITISTLMQTLSRWAINSISQEVQIGKAISGLAGSLGSFFGITSPTTTGSEGQTNIGHGVGSDTLQSMHGNIFEHGNVVPFASGGAVVNRRTVFPMRGGYGSIAEAGAEGIFPLTRTSGGDLGVKAVRSSVNVKINNYGGARVQARDDGDGVTIDIDSIVADVVGRRGSRTNRAIRGLR